MMPELVRARRRYWVPSLLICLILTASLLAPSARAQSAPEARGSRNVEVVGTLALEGLQPSAAERDAAGWRTANLVIEQDLDRPFVYVARRYGPAGFDVVNVADPAHPAVLTSWTLDGAHTGPGAQGITYFKHEGRTYLVQAFQFDADSADADLAAVVFDVTDLPDASALREVQRVRVPGGFRSVFAYKHSNGMPLLLAAGDGDAHIYDLTHLLDGHVEPVATLATPEQLERGVSGYYDVKAAFHTETLQDRFYGAGGGGYHVINITDPAAPEEVTSVSPAATRQGHFVAPTPDGRYLVTTAEYRNAPVRIFDLQPVFDGTARGVRTAVGAWTANWQNFAQRLEVRWPYVLVASLEDGFQMFNMRDPESPYTMAYYHTYEGEPGSIAEGDKQLRGAWDIGVRNADGLIVVSDLDTGLWTLRVEGFENWEGRGWGVPDVSSAQNWE